ncbi:MAG TPA: BON domain-containing protein [Pyrinomonadaceae bacterium]|nr:BON domain-containing protein [Pyrinomonadaceae bacterium]
MANYYDRDYQRSGIRRGAGYRSAFDRYSGYEPDEPYFGSGRQNYGEGYIDSPERNYGSWSDDYEGDPENRGEPRRRPPSPRRYSRGYGDRAQAYGEGRYFDRSGYGRYGSPYPESERGFFTDRDYELAGERGWWDRTSDEISSWFGDREAAHRREMDYRRDHRGRGPKNYTRSDDRIREDINDRLTESSFIDASDIDVAVSDHEVTLTGTVETRYEKRMAEDIADDVTGVSNVENRIRVNPSTYGTRSASHAGSTTTETSPVTSRSRTAGS